ncbi:MAG: ribonuclease HII [Ignavibacteria bacterium]|nr:ribonuclease HII [Ignavibacteria bacterium]
MKRPNFDIEKKFWEIGKLVAGVDEAGRGSLAGPVFASAVIFPLNFVPDYEVFDSKTISPKVRAKIYEKIISTCLAFSTYFVPAYQIDEINILKATILAMNKALEQLADYAPYVLIDGNRFEGPYEFSTIVDGDTKSFSIAAASIVAKVERDNWMSEVAHKLYPIYGFDRHKGYATKMHIEKILKYQPSPLHRKTFLNKILLDISGK